MFDVLEGILGLEYTVNILKLVLIVDNCFVFDFSEGVLWPQVYR